MVSSLVVYKSGVQGGSSAVVTQRTNRTFRTFLAKVWDIRVATPPRQDEINRTR
jgi:hypothetical protein